MSKSIHIFVVVMFVPVARPISVHGFLKQPYEGGWKDGQRKCKSQKGGSKA